MTDHLDPKQMLTLARTNISSRLRTIAGRTKNANIDEIAKLHDLLDEFAQWRREQRQNAGQP